MLESNKLNLNQMGIRSLYGVGEKRAAAYARLGIKTIEDLLYYFPRAYENRGNIRRLADSPSDEKSAVVLTVMSEPSSARLKGGRGQSILKFKAFDDSGICTVVFFNQPYLKDKFPTGSVFRFWGRVDRLGSGFSMTSPDFEPYSDAAPPEPLVPVYRLAEGLSAKQIARDVKLAWSVAADKIADALPEEIRERAGVCTLSYALRNVHQPESCEALTAAKRRLVFDELFFFALGLSSARRRLREGRAIPCRNNDISSLTRMLPYSLTQAQLKVINEIRADMEKSVPMRRIVVGDVGCGKTICAAAAMLIAVQSGRQAALMAPTEILARQHFEDLSPIFSQLGYSCELLVGATPPAKKNKIRKALAEQRAEERLDIVIGTHALLSEGVEFSAPGIVVTDEQHRFGVNQRAALTEKNEQAHVLVMSATPIPRSLALVLYGDLDISRIDQMPPGRQRVETYAVDESYRSRVDNFIRRMTAEGGQVYIVCPAIEDQESEVGELTLKELTSRANQKEEPQALHAVESYARELQTKIPELRISIMHGKMKSAEKESIMKRFSAGDIDVLVSTTVIEVGVNVPNACLMIVENAEQFGLSQLHQLRGRVGRGKRKSYCILMSNAKGDNAKKRLETMCTMYDGYKIAEADLAMRGPGDFIAGDSSEGIRQSGEIRFRLASLCDDTELLSAAFDEARKLTAKDPELQGHPELKRLIGTVIKDSDMYIS